MGASKNEAHLGVLAAHDDDAPRLLAGVGADAHHMRARRDDDAHGRGVADVPTVDAYAAPA
jgi:hypothetical protein